MWSSSASQCNVRHKKRSNVPYFHPLVPYRQLLLTVVEESLLASCWHFRHYYGNQYRYIRYWLTTQNKCIPIHQMQNDMHFHICKPNQSWAQCEQSIYKKKRQQNAWIEYKLQKLHILWRYNTSDFSLKNPVLSGNCLKRTKDDRPAMTTYGSYES